MYKKLKIYSTLAIGSLCLLANTAAAETISLEYKGFFDRLKQVNKGHYQLVEIAFSVPKQSNCVMTDGSITSEKISTPLTYTQDQRLFIPFDADLKDQRALVNLVFPGSADGCAIAMQVRAKQTQLEYDKARLEQVLTEMDTLLADMQGFPMRYFREPIAGLNFEFAPEQDIQLELNGREQVVRDSFKVSAEQLANIENLRFSQAPKVLSPWVK